MSAPSCVPVIFGPGITPHCTATSWWTPLHTGLAAAAAVLAVAVLAAVATHRRCYGEDAMSRSDRAAWRSARTLADLGHAGAQWLEGDIAMQPAWRAGPDEETLPLVPMLAALNRAGFYTTSSSPGDDGTCSGNVRWRQRAAVEGFADAGLAARLYLAAHEAGLITVTHDPASLPRKHWNTALEVAVTERDGSPYTWFGQQWCRREIRSRQHWGICRRAAQDALCSAWQVTIADPEWGREQSPLWDVLAAAIRPAPAMIP